MRSEPGRHAKNERACANAAPIRKLSSPIDRVDFGVEQGTSAFRHETQISGFCAMVFCFPNISGGSGSEANDADQEIFIGLVVEPGTMVVYSGAQQPLIGSPQLKSLEEHLWEKLRLKVRWVNKNTSSLGGIGGRAKVLGEVEIPIGLNGTCGIITMKVTDQDVPPLIPSGFLKATRATLDYDHNKITWNGIGHTCLRANSMYHSTTFAPRCA